MSVGMRMPIGVHGRLQDTEGQLRHQAHTLSIIFPAIPLCPSGPASAHPCARQTCIFFSLRLQQNFCAFQLQYGAAALSRSALISRFFHKSGGNALLSRIFPGISVIFPCISPQKYRSAWAKSDIHSISSQTAKRKRFFSSALLFLPHLRHFACPSRKSVKEQPRFGKAALPSAVLQCRHPERIPSLPAPLGLPSPGGRPFILRKDCIAHV